MNEKKKALRAVYTKTFVSPELQHFILVLKLFGGDISNRNVSLKQNTLGKVEMKHSDFLKFCFSPHVKGNGLGNNLMNLT